jgi:hypothetical protein
MIHLVEQNSIPVNFDSPLHKMVGFSYIRSHDDLSVTNITKFGAAISLNIRATLVQISSATSVL